MFNFFYELKKNVKNFNDSYQLINMSGRLIYFEGHRGITFFSDSEIIFKIADGEIRILGSELSVQELTENTLKVYGKIEKVEECK